jgi:hypothetical protein
MNSPAFPVVASRLCAACGMCCDGTMFQVVRMQPGDYPAELTRLGMRIRRQEDGFVMEQPCAGLCERRCTIYEARPARCRAFLCQQLRLVEGHAITEAEAQARIDLAGRLAAEVRALITQSGYREDGAPLQEQYDRVTVVPVNAELEPEQVPVRQKLEATMRVLKTILRRDFLPPPGSH